jgi:hypothetical protein
MSLGRLNLLILIAFPVFAFGAIQVANSILPAKYYFSLSTLAKGADEPFIVEPPSITQQRFCSLLAKYHLQPGEAGLPYINCAELDEGLPDSTATYQPSAEEKDAIYRIALQSGGRALEILKEEAGKFPRQAVAPEAVDQILQTSNSQREAVRRISEQYIQPLRDYSLDGANAIASFFANEFASLTGTTPPAGEDGGSSVDPAANPGALTAEEAERVRVLHRSFAERHASLDLSVGYTTIKVQDIESILKNSYTPEDVSRGVQHFYAVQPVEQLQNRLKDHFFSSQSGLVDERQVRTQLLQEASATGVGHYVVAAIARVAPIFLVALAFGLYFGRAEVLSISFGAALLALLLVWPILLLWDMVVRSQWVSYRAMFVGIYALYILAFFAVARTGALVGSLLGQKTGIHTERGETFEAGAVGIGDYRREILVSFVASALFSLFVFSINLLLPLQS